MFLSNKCHLILILCKVLQVQILFVNSVIPSEMLRRVAYTIKDKLILYMPATYQMSATYQTATVL